MNVVYLLEADIYKYEGEDDWLTGFKAVYQTAESAMEGLKLWCLDNYIDPAEATEGMSAGEYFTGHDGEVSMEEDTVFLSWGINQMEVQA